MTTKHWEFTVETAQILAHPENQNVDIVSWFPMPYLKSQYNSKLVPLNFKEHNLALSLMSVGLKK